jgi:hypothetical protein
MTSAAVLEQFAATREQLDSVCQLLISPAPEVLDRCAGLLESAGRQLTECQPQLAAMRGDPAAIEAAWMLRRSFVTADKLLQSAARFHTNWTAIRGALTGGYTVRGQAAPVRHAGRICIEA